MRTTIPLIVSDPRGIEALSCVRVLYTDIDGTLVSSNGSVLADDSGAPSLGLAGAIVDVARTGLSVVPVSGRTLLQLREVTQMLGWHGYIAEAGGLIVNGLGLSADVHIESGTWDADILADGSTPFEIITAAGVIEALMDAFPGEIEPYSSWQIDRYVTLLLRGCLNHADGQAFLDTLPLPLDFIDNGLVRSPGALVCGNRAPHAYHVVPRGVSKMAAIRADLAARGLSREEAAAIGDSSADLAMADAVGVMVLVANAFESVGVTSALEATPHDNVWRTEANRCDGWTEFAHAWVGATAG